MYRMLLASLIAAVCAVPAVGQEELNAPVQDGKVEQANEIIVTPEAWEYVRQRMDYDTPEARVQRNAAFRSAQRRMRIASREWYGVSLSRPTASPVPHMGIYSPMWAGTYSEPSLWMSYGRYNSYRVTDAGLR